MLITCRLEFDSGHRIPHHQSQCQHLHGHRYAIEITLSGDIVETAGSPRQGMVMDFSDVKKIARREIVDTWDHAFLVCRADRVVLDFLNGIPGHKTVVLPNVPTAENLAIEAFRILDQAYQDCYGNHLRLERVRLFETPNSWADAVRGEPSAG